MIRILCADVSSADAQAYDLLYKTASPERRAKADNLRKPQDRLRCVTAHALLRAALGAKEFPVEIQPGGKPRIPGREDFFYNLSHSGRYVAIAWGSSPVGVDVQAHDPAVDREALARRYFTAEEQAYIGGDMRRFYEIWTKKESYLKYTGTGLRRPLKSFLVLSPEPGLRFHLRHPDSDHSLCLCAAEDTCAFTLLDIRRLLP